MTQPSLPDAAAQKQAAVEVFAQYEPPLYEAYLEMMLEWLAAVKTAMFAGGVAKLGLIPDPLSVFSKTPMWNDLTDKYTEQVAREVLAAPYKNLFANGTLFESRPFVRNWIAERSNRLQNVPNEVFGLVRHVIDSATTNGASIPDVQEQIEKLFSAADVQTWKNRARTVARTEVVGAYNGGMYDAFAMLVEADPDTAWVKRWLATEDHRTRPDHREADGQAVPWGQAFTVGGFSMQYPHDPAAPPKEVINCRCTMLLEIKNEPTEMGNRQYLSASFNPLEKRDKDGKWTKGGSLLKSLIKKGTKGAEHHETAPVPEKPSPIERNPLHKITRSGARGSRSSGGEAAGDDAIKAFPAVASTATGEERSRLQHYADNGFEQINLALAGLPAGQPLDNLDQHDPGIHGRWGGKKIPGLVRNTVTTMDGHMKPSTRDAVLYRGVRDLKGSFGDLADSDLTGTEFEQKSYASSTANHLLARGFAGDKRTGAVLRMHVPQGTRGMQMNLYSGDHGEDEVTLARGLRYRVTGDSRDEYGNRYLDVEVINGDR